MYATPYPVVNAHYQPTLMGAAPFQQHPQQQQQQHNAMGLSQPHDGLAPFLPATVFTTPPAGYPSQLQPQHIVPPQQQQQSLPPLTAVSLHQITTGGAMGGGVNGGIVAPQPTVPQGYVLMSTNGSVTPHPTTASTASTGSASVPLHSPPIAPVFQQFALHPQQQHQAQLVHTLPPAAAMAVPLPQQLPQQQQPSAAAFGFGGFRPLQNHPQQHPTPFYYQQVPVPNASTYAPPPTAAASLPAVTPTTTTAMGVSPQIPMTAAFAATAYQQAPAVTATASASAAATAAAAYRAQAQQQQLLQQQQFLTSTAVTGGSAGGGGSYSHSGSANLSPSANPATIGGGGNSCSALNISSNVSDAGSAGSRGSGGGGSSSGIQHPNVRMPKVYYPMPDASAAAPLTTTTTQAAPAPQPQQGGSGGAAVATVPQGGARFGFGGAFAFHPLAHPSMNVTPPVADGGVVAQNPMLAVNPTAGIVGGYPINSLSLTSQQQLLSSNVNNNVSGNGNSSMQWGDRPASSLSTSATNIVLSNVNTAMAGVVGLYPSP